MNAEYATLEKSIQFLSLSQVLEMAACLSDPSEATDTEIETALDSLSSTLATVRPEVLS